MPAARGRTSTSRTSTPAPHGSRSSVASQGTRSPCPRWAGSRSARTTRETSSASGRRIRTRPARRTDERGAARGGAAPAVPRSAARTWVTPTKGTAMPFYQRRGEVPRKRHIVFRENGRLLTEEVMGLERFTGNESILYHLESPCRVKELGAFTPIEREEWVPETHAHRLQNTYDVPPSGDEISGRRTLMWNADVEIAFCRPDSTMDYFFRNGEGDEVVFVHEGSGTLETIFGDVPYKDGDYVVIPRGTTYRFLPEGPQRYLVFETPGLIEIPR